MKKFLLLLLFLSVILVHGFAGDVAKYKDLGFSADGSKFVFAQFGVIDKSFQAWAEIFTVDIPTNTYVKSAIFSINPSNATSGKSGVSVYDDLFKKNSSVLSQYAVKPVSIDKTLYIRGNESKKADEPISFKDYEGITSGEDTYFTVQRIMYTQGSGANTLSSFYIVVERKDGDGKTISSQVIGTPDYKRKGVIDYTIEKIWTDESGKNLAILVEKKIVDATGISIRYMIEANPIK